MSDTVFSFDVIFFHFIYLAQESRDNYIFYMVFGIVFVFGSVEWGVISAFGAELPLHRVAKKKWAYMHPRADTTPI